MVSTAEADMPPHINMWPACNTLCTNDDDAQITCELQIHAVSFGHSVNFSLTYPTWNARTNEKGICILLHCIVVKLNRQTSFMICKSVHDKCKRGEWPLGLCVLDLDRVSIWTTRGVCLCIFVYPCTCTSAVGRMCTPPNRSIESLSLS